jgi:uncharacterized protein Yka (UPF0111/DUF47 family)
MSVNGKRSGFSRDDLISLAKQAGIKRNPANDMLERVLSAAMKWEQFADEAKITEERADQIKRVLRVNRL